MSLARGTVAVLIAALSIGYADRTGKQTIRNLETIHQDMLPLPQA